MCAAGLLPLVDQAMVDGIQGQFEAIGNTQLIEDIVEMVFYGLFADKELLADFSVAESLGDELHDFLFAIAQ